MGLIWCSLTRAYALTGGVTGARRLARVLGARGGVLQKLFALATGDAFLGSLRGACAGVAALPGLCNTFARAETPTELRGMFTHTEAPTGPHSGV